MTIAATIADPVLRPAVAGDLPAAERLLAESGLPTADLPALFASRAGDFVVADDPAGSGELVAVAGLEVCGGDALLRSVAVRPAWRRHGLGERLVRRLVADAEQRGLRALWLLTLTAERYFPRFGFQVTGRDAVPEAVRATSEFREACPASATVMTCPLDDARRVRATGPGPVAGDPAVDAGLDARVGESRRQG